MTDVFIASNMPTSYPLKLQKPSTVSDRVRETADVYILDSGIGDDVSNREVLDLAVEYDADYVIGKDYLHDLERTGESVHEFLELYRTHECTATPLVPVQCNPQEDNLHVDNLKHLPNASHYVLGGMAVNNIDAGKKVKSIRDFREAVGESAYIHGLGIGGGIELASKLAGEGLIDSVDCSTPEQSAMYGSVIDERLRQNQVMVFDGGDGRMARTYPLAEFNSYQIRDVWEREASVGSLEQFENRQEESDDE